MTKLAPTHAQKQKKKAKSVMADDSEEEEEEIDSECLHLEPRPPTSVTL